MIIRKKTGFNLQPVLDTLSDFREIKSEKSYSFQRFGVMDEFESYLTTALTATDATDAFLRTVVEKSMHTQQSMTEGSFLAACNSVAKDLHKNQSEFRVVFPIWGGKNILLGRKKWDDVTITFNINTNSAFAKQAIRERTAQIEKSDNTSTRIARKINALPLCTCSVKAINTSDAFEKSENAISKELGLYSVLLGRGKFIITQEPDTPINTILIAPHMTVHTKNGKMSSSVFWYNRWPDHLSEKFLPAEDIAHWKNQAEELRNKVKRLPWRPQAERALARHYTAFSQIDLESSFLDGWRLLESIAGHKSEKSEVLVKRAAWFFENREFYYQMGMHLMQRRHLISHGRAVREDSHETLAFQMKRFITPFLLAFLTNPFNFQNIEEFWSFCDLPVEKATRKRQAYFLQCAQKFRNEN